MSITNITEREQELAAQVKAFKAENDRLEVEKAALQRRLDWAANELLACDYGDNLGTGDTQVGWVVYGWRDKEVFDKPHGQKRRIYGRTIDEAIDSVIK